MPVGFVVRRHRLPRRDRMDLLRARCCARALRPPRARVRCRDAARTLGRLPGSSLTVLSCLHDSWRRQAGSRSRVGARAAQVSARRAASSNGVSSSGSSFRIRSSRAIVGLRSPSTSGRATDAFTGVTRLSQSEERYGVSTGKSTIAGLRVVEDRLDQPRTGSRRTSAPRVAALVYSAAFAPDESESLNTLAAD